MNVKEKTCSNLVCAAGAIMRPLEYSHSIYGEKFYSTALSIKRNSGTFDTIITIISERLIFDIDLNIGDFVSIKGEFRSWNSPQNHLKLYIFAKSIEKLSEETYENKITLTGFICRQPVYRQTPMGREIADVLIATNRNYNKSDYIPLIFWSRNAMYVNTLNVGDKISSTGRIQSRDYLKCENGVWVQKVAYEISCICVEKY